MVTSLGSLSNVFSQNMNIILSGQSNEEDRLGEYYRVESSNNYNRSNIIADNMTQNTTNLTSASTQKKILFKVVKNEPILPIVNSIISNAWLNCVLNLRHIALSIENTSYEPKKFGYAEVVLKNPKSYFKVFSSGFIHCSGTKTPLDSKRACRKLAKIIKSLNYEVRFSDFKIDYVHTTADTRFRISLSKMTKLLEHDSKFKTEDFNDRSKTTNGGKFSGLKVKKCNSSAVLILFHSGKINITACKNHQEAIDVFNEFFPYLLKVKSIYD